MHASKLSLEIWFWAAYLMATHSNGISALQLKNQLGPAPLDWKGVRVGQRVDRGATVQPPSLLTRQGGRDLVTKQGNGAPGVVEVTAGKLCRVEVHPVEGIPCQQLGQSVGRVGGRLGDDR